MKHMQAKLIRRRPSRETRFAFFALLLAAAGLSILSGCRNPLNRSGDRPDEPAMGTFVLTIGGRDMSRTIAPDWPGNDNVSFTLAFTSLSTPPHSFNVTNWNPGTPGNPGTPVPLLSGTWSLTVTVFPRTGNTALPIARGNLPPFDVSPTGVTPGTVTLMPIIYPDSPPGIFSWAIVEDNITVTNTHLLITRLDGTIVYDKPDAGVIGSIYTLLPGTYNVVFTLTVAGDRENAVMREVLRIYSNMRSQFDAKLTDLHFPTTLLNVILGAWSNYNVPNSTGNAPGSIRAYLLYRGLQTGHFGLLDPAITGLGFLDGFDPADFQAFLDWFDTLSRTGSGSGSGPGPIPYDLPSLARLVDAALVGVAMLGNPGSPVYRPALGNRLDTQDHIRALAVNNRNVADFVTFAWQGVNDPVSVTVGEYTFPVSFATPVYDFTVTFHANDAGGGIVAPPLVRVYGGQLLRLDGLTRPGFTFAGWNTQSNGGGRQYIGFVEVRANLNLFARWIPHPVVGTPNPHLVTITLNPGYSGLDTTTVSVLPGMEIILPQLARSGYGFEGWRNPAGNLFAGGTLFTVNENVTLTGNWTAPAQTFTVRLRPNGGVGAEIAMTSVIDGSIITLPTGGFVRQWHEFEGWSEDPASVSVLGPELAVTRDFTLYAVWSTRSYTVTFDHNVDGGGVYATETRPYGYILSLPVPSTANPGHTFIGWNTERDGDGGIHLGLSPYRITHGLTLFGRWMSDDEPDVRVTYRNHDGSLISYRDVPIGTDIRLSDGVDRNDHVFLGWRVNNTGPLFAGNSPFTVFGTTYLYAQFYEIEPGQTPPAVFRVTLNPGDGPTGPASGTPVVLTQVPSGTEISLSAGHDFAYPYHVVTGWRDRDLGITHPPGNFIVGLGNVDLYAEWEQTTVEAVQVSTEPSSFHRGTVNRLSAVVFAPTGSPAPPQDVLWSIPAGGDLGVSIENISTGDFRIADTATYGQSFTIRATSTFDPGRYGEATVNILTPVATGITIAPVDNLPSATLRGGSLQFEVTEISGDGNPRLGASIYWAVARTSGGPELHVGDNANTTTGITGNGLLSVAATPNQALGQIYVQATVTNRGDDRSTNRVVTISPPTNVAVSITAFDEREIYVYRNNNRRFTATVTGEGFPSQSVAWRVAGGTRPGTVINENGMLTVPGSEPALSLTVAADSLYSVPGSTNVGLRGPVPIGDWRIVRVGIDHTMAITWDNELYTWGRGTHGQLGHGGRWVSPTGDGDPYPEHNRDIPTRVKLGTYDWIDVAGGWAHTVALRADGSIWGAGRIFDGGHGNVNNMRVDFTASFDQIGTDTDWAHVAATHSSVFAIKLDGTMYAWGANTGGVLGIGNTDFQDEPVQVGRSTAGNALGAGGAGLRSDWASVTASSNHALALTTSGELFGWGSNAQSQLGTGATNYPRPITPGRQWSMVTAGTEFSAGICYVSEGLYTWGSNGHGRLGTPGMAMNSTRSSPTRIITGSTFESIRLNVTTHGIAICSDGNVWTWGNDQFSQLGRGTPNDTDRRTPIVITEGSSVATEDRTDVDLGAKTWTDSIGGGSFSLAINDRGELWGWGHNSFGMLGNRDTENRNRPVQIFK